MQRFGSLAFSATDPRRRAAEQQSLPFWFAMFALFLYFALSPNVFGALGLDFGSPDANPLVKVHPGTHIVIIAGLFYLCRSKYEFARLCHESPALMTYLLVIPLLGFYAMIWSGYSGSAVYIENYWSAGMMALLLQSGTEEQRRKLGWFLLWVCLINVTVAIYENLTFSHIFPLVLAAEQIDPTDIDFRAHAFFGHPLTAALVMFLAFPLVYAMRLRTLLTGAIIGFLLVGMLAFGGRAALGITLIITGATIIYLFFRGILQRQMELDFMVMLVLALIVIPLVLVVVVATTPIADRILGTLYFDDSAMAREEQWKVLSHLTMSNWLFGVSMVDLMHLKYQIGLGRDDTDIENFWLLMFLNLGGIGFAVFVAILLTFLVHLGRYARQPAGWVLLVGAIIIESGSNSLGVKTSDLCIIAAFMVALSAFQKVTVPPVVRQPRRRTSVLRPLQGLLLGDPTPQRARALASNAQGRRSLATGPVDRTPGA